MWRGKEVAVILPTYNEKDSIRGSVEAFFSTGVVDEVIVVNNNAATGTSEELCGTGAKEIKESRQGYGYALLCGIDYCNADIMVFAEPDGTFVGTDVLKLLAYSDDKPVVFGTRTVREFIWKGANMGIFLKWGNWAVAKMAEMLFNTTILTDMGCSMRLFSKEAMTRIRPHLTIGGSHFGAQILMEVIAHRIPFIEIPVNYKKRVGVSMATGSLFKAFAIGVSMILMILKYRIGLSKIERKIWTENDSTFHLKLAHQPLDLFRRRTDTFCSGSNANA